MIRNYIKVSLRNLAKKKAYSLINILGLAVGITSCLLIVLFIQHEFSYDRFFKDHERVYRMPLERIYPNHSTYYAVVPHSFAARAKESFGEIEEATIAARVTNQELTYINEREESVRFVEEIILAADSSFLKVFPMDPVGGKYGNLLTKADEIVISEEFAGRYFGSEDPIGKVIKLGEEMEFAVSAVIPDLPENSHMKFSALISILAHPMITRENYTTFSAYTYFKLREGVDPKVIESKMPQLVDTYAAGQIERELNKSWTEYKAAGNGYRYFLQSLSSIHLDPQNIEAQMKPSGNINSIYILIGVAILILGIACVNFMNLSIARSAERAKEIGVRKVMGSLRQQLMGQFLTEAFCLAALGVIIALALTVLLMPAFNELTEKQIELPFNLLTVIGFVGLVLVVGLLAGIYPATVLSSFKPVEVMKGKFTGSQNGQWIRNGLVVFQFWISIILIIGTLVIRNQMQYMQEVSLGFDKEHVLVLETGFNFEPQKLQTFVEEIRGLPEVKEAAATFALPGREGAFFGIHFQPEGSSEILTTKSMVVADGLAETLGLELVEGRWFSENSHDSLYVILNETAVQLMDIENPIGAKLIEVRNEEDETQVLQHTIIGIVRDFNFLSLRDEITPLVLQSNELFGVGGQFVVARIHPNEIPNAISAIETKWMQIGPEQAFQYSFLNENLNNQYRQEQQVGQIFSIFSGLAIFVSCIGLFGLSAYVTSLRTKEIGVRKVLGASVYGVILMLNKDFSKMILLAFLLAAPVAWWLMDKWWLENFAFRVNVNGWVMLAAGLLVLLLAWLTVSFQTFKAALANPVESLKSE
ncbi:ABC transporter permease [Litoribacter populi]|uniref:ABC transporter permease n=1 Tax=Litoribacter populi TaxID=2598460 RepID=UPI001180A318|nr:ABC transporter permease [Litoribacter populi]